MGRLILTAFLLASYFVSSSNAIASDVAGEVFLLMKNGEVKRGAGIQVSAIKPGQRFGDVWAKLLDRCNKEYGEALAESKRATQAMLDHVNKPGRSWTDPGDSRETKRVDEEASRAANEAGRTLARYRVAAASAIHQASAATTQIGADGRYLIRDLPAGPVFVFAEMPLFDLFHYWMILTNVKDGQNRVDLTVQNLGWDFDRCRVPLPSLQ